MVGEKEKVIIEEDLNRAVEKLKSQGVRVEAIGLSEWQALMLTVLHRLAETAEWN